MTLSNLASPTLIRFMTRLNLTPRTHPARDADGARFLARPRRVVPSAGPSHELLGPLIRMYMFLFGVHWLSCVTYIYVLTFLCRPRVAYRWLAVKFTSLPRVGCRRCICLLDRIGVVP